MRTFRTFINFFSAEIEIFAAGTILVLFLTIVTMSLSMNQFFGTTIYLSRFFLAILISMIIAGISIQISNVKRLTDGYTGYLFSSIAVIANSAALIFETFEMTFYGMNWFGFEFFRVQTNNSFLYLIGFLIFLYTVLMTIISMLDLLYAVGES